MPRIQVQSAAKNISATHGSKTKLIIKLELKKDATNILRDGATQSFYNFVLPVLKAEAKSCAMRLAYFMNKSYELPEEDRWVYQTISEAFFTSMYKGVAGRVINDNIPKENIPDELRHIALTMIDWSKIHGVKEIILSQCLADLDLSEVKHIIDYFRDEAINIGFDKHRQIGYSANVACLLGYGKNGLGVFDTSNISKEEQTNLLQSANQTLRFLDLFMMVVKKSWNTNALSSCSTQDELMAKFGTIVSDYGSPWVDDYEYALKSPYLKELAFNIARSWTDEKSEEIDKCIYRKSDAMGGHRSSILCKFGWNKDSDRFEYINATTKNKARNSSARWDYKMNKRFLGEGGDYSIRVETDEAIYVLENIIGCQPIDSNVTIQVSDEGDSAPQEGKFDSFISLVSFI